MSEGEEKWLKVLIKMDCDPGILVKTNDHLRVKGDV